MNWTEAISWLFLIIHLTIIGFIEFLKILLGIIKDLGGAL